MNIAYNLFLLMFNLSQLHNKEKIVELFLGGMSEVFSPAFFLFIENKRKKYELEIEIRTRNSSFGFIVIEKPGSLSEESKILINNSVQMLAVILERLSFDEKLKEEKKSLEQIADERFVELQTVIKELEDARKASLKLIDNLTFEIDNRTKYEEKLKESEGKYRELVENSPDAIIIHQDGKIVYANSECLLLAGATRFEDLTAKSLIEFVHPDFRSLAIERIKNIQNEGVHAPPVEEKFLSLEGKEIDVEVVGMPLKYEHKPAIQLIIRNITKRKQAEKDIREANEKFLSLAQNISGFIAYVNADTLKYEFVNEMYEKAFGFPKEKIIGCHIKNIIGEASYQIALKYINKVKSGEPCSYENTFNFESGKRWIEIHYNPIFDSNRNVKSIAVLGSDITGRKKAEEEIVKKQKQLNAHINHSPMATIEWDSNFIVTRWAGESEKIFGWNEKEALGKPIMDLNMIFEDDIPIVEKTMQSLSNSSAEKVVSSNRNYTKDGKVIYCEWYNTSLFDEKGKMISVMSQVLDITNRKLSEMALQKNEAIQRKMVANIADVIVIIDPEGINRYKSPNVEKLFGWKVEELEGKNAFENVYPEDLNFVQQAFISLSKKKNNTINLEFRYRCKDGIYKWIEFTGVNLFHDSDIHGILGNYHDITDRKKTRDELLKAKEKAEESDRLKSAFLANMSHEIRTPMNGILGFTSLLQEPNLTGEEQQKYIEIIQKSGNRMLTTVNDIIDISKIEAGQMAVSISEINILEKLKNTYLFFKPEADKKGIELNLENVLFENKIIIQSDKEKLNSVLTNLVKNAIKFCDDGTVEFGCSVKEDKLLFFVKDTGTGIPKDRQQAIFDRFVQADIEDRNAKQGSGLGLSISKAYVEMLGGRIWVESEPGKGSSFYFTIPYTIKSKEKNNIKEFVTIDKNMGEIKNINIVIAEDDPASVMLLKIMLKPIAKNIWITSTGTETVEMCRNNPDIDLVLMDIQMPEMNGFEATRQIRQFNKEIIIIAQTAFALTGDRKKALEAGCNDYISKPIKKEMLIEMVQKYF